MFSTPRIFATRQPNFGLTSSLFEMYVRLCPEGRNGWWLKAYPAKGALASCTIKRVLSANRKSSQEDENEKCKHALGVAGSAWGGPGGIEVEQI